MSFRPDPTFYPSPRMAMQAPPERLAYVAAFDAAAALGQPGTQRSDGLAVIDVERGSSTFGQQIGFTELPTTGDELHHSGWNACSSALCPYAPHPHVERRYLMLPALRSSRIFVFDVKSDPRAPKLHRVIEAEEIASRAGYSRPHTLHCGPDGIYVSALGNAEGDGPGGIFVLDCDSFDVLGRWEIDRGPQFLHYDFWWHLGFDTLVSSEWGTPKMIEGGIDPELLLGRKYGHRLHVWNLRRRRHEQVLDIGDQHQLALELRPAHDPTRPYGFMGVVISVENLAASIWLWHRKGSQWAIDKVIEIPAEPASADELPPLLKDFKAVPPLVTDINLSLDDRFLYVSCWGTGQLLQYDVSDPFKPRRTGEVRLGGIAKRAAHPRSGPLTGAPQMVEVSRDGRRVYFTSSLYAAWDEQFYPDGVTGWMAKVDVGDGGGMQVDPEFFVDFGPYRSHQVRLEGGDASSDSFCFP
jgi:selenium-binding protein 1